MQQTEGMGSPCVLWRGRKTWDGDGVESGLLLLPCPALFPAPPFAGLQGCVFVSARTLGAKHSCLPAVTMATHPDRRERRGRPLPLLGNAMLCQAYSGR